MSWQGIIMIRLKKTTLLSTSRRVRFLGFATRFMEVRAALIPSGGL